MKKHPNESVLQSGYKPNEDMLRESGYSKKDGAWVKVDGVFKHLLVWDGERERWCLRTERA